jgi:hypothetical protein
MNMRTAIFGLALSSTMLLAGCTTPGRFEWGGYESALYVYAKKPDQRPAYRAALEQAVERGRRTNRLAPGLLSELGYLSLEDGDVGAAVALFEEEMNAFPESRPFLTSVVARARGSNAPSAIKTEVKS